MSGELATAPPPAETAYLDVDKITVGYGRAPVLDEFSLRVRRGELVSLLGPSGCGKTTLLRVIAGLINPTRGSIGIEGQDIARLPIHRRRIGVVFQSYALFPNLDVAGNVAFGLRARGESKTEIDGKVREVLALVRMSKFADCSVRVLSGGQQQRVAVARALAIKPRILLLDEPFSALDRQLRETVQIELRRLLRDLRITAIFVTHDQDEALLMSDRIAVMKMGHIEQLDSAVRIHARPATPFVLDFVGLSTKLNGKVCASDSNMVAVDTSAGRIRSRANYIPGAKVCVAVRAERITIGGAVSPDDNEVELALTDVIYRGSRQILEFEACPGDRALVELSGPPGTWVVGQRTKLRWAIDDTLIYLATDDALSLDGDSHG